PAFEVNAPLVSRSQVFVFETLEDKDIEKIIRRAVKKFYPRHKIAAAALNHMVKSANGDARSALNTLELAGQMTTNINLSAAEAASQKKAIYYDKKGDWHYDVISAFIKSLRGSDPDAAVYWLARMLEAGEDPMFIARRMVILASEDVGNANPNALVLAIAAMQAVHMVGLPEARIILSQTATYLASSPKSNASYLAIDQAQQDVRNERLEGVPIHLRNAPTDLAKKLDHGKDYQYPHNFQDGFIEQQYLPDNLIDKIYYQPKEIGKEAAIKKHLESLRPRRYATKKSLKSRHCPKNLDNN
ncbi:MAG: AAA ATPase central domain protein, partial [Candidatus Berkelbacteria bacterium Licking1014_2]